MDKEIVIRRLAISKFLYKLGMEQSYLTESMSFTSLLSFHDSIEIFLKTLADLRNIKTDKLSFMEYWDKIPELTLKEPLRNLNNLRVNLKHKGILPSRQDLDLIRSYVTEFLRENCETNFKIDFGAISLVDLVQYESTRDYIKKAQSALDKKNIPLQLKKLHMHSMIY